MYEYILGREKLHIVQQRNKEYHFGFYNANAIIIVIYDIDKDNDVVINRTHKHTYIISNNDVHIVIHSKNKFEMKKIETICRTEKNIFKKLINNIKFESGF